MTKYAQAIQQIVESSGYHMTADQIFIQLRQIYPTVALATVYNNLGKLCQSGLLRKISAEGMPDRYDRPQRHDHLICQVCGKLADLHLADLTDQLQQQLDIPFLSYDLKLIYICDECRQKMEQGAHRDSITP